MQRPIIGIAASYLVDKQHILLRDTYTNAILKAGGMPLILPVTCEESVIDDMLNCIDGLLLSGGGDVDPALYGEEKLPECGESNVIRDTFELLIIKKARERQMPIFGICRGLQVLAVSFGSKLIQDIASSHDCAREKHYQPEPFSTPWHEIKLSSGGLLQRITGVDHFMTNSMHHQAILVPGNSLVVEAKSLDGIIEAISVRDNDAVFGVQFHPEHLIDQSNCAMALFTHFVSKADMFHRKK